MSSKVRLIYIQALKENRNWFRPLKFNIYVLNTQGEKWLLKFPINVK